MLRAGTNWLTFAVAAFATTLLMGQAIDPGSPIMAPSADEPTPAVDRSPPAIADEGSHTPPPESKTVVVPVEVPPASPSAAEPAETEVLPWANAPIVAAPATAPDAAQAAAAARCAVLFEAQCRETKACAWVADIRQADGTMVPARCAARGSAPPKKAAKAKPKPKPKPKLEASAPEDAPKPAAVAPAPAAAPAAPAPAPAPAAPAEPSSSGIIVTVPPKSE